VTICVLVNKAIFSQDDAVKHAKYKVIKCHKSNVNFSIYENGFITVQNVLRVKTSFWGFTLKPPSRGLLLLHPVWSQAPIPHLLPHTIRSWRRHCCAKTAEPIEMLLEADSRTHVDPKKHVLEWGLSLLEKVHF